MSRTHQAASEDDPQLLTKSENDHSPLAISPDGNFLLFTERHPETASDLLWMPLEAAAAAKPKPWIRTTFQ